MFVKQNPPLTLVKQEYIYKKKTNKKHKWFIFKILLLYRNTWKDNLQMFLFLNGPWVKPGVLCALFAKSYTKNFGNLLVFQSFPPRRLRYQST